MSGVEGLVELAGVEQPGPGVERPGVEVASYIILSNATVAHSASVGATIGALAVVDGISSYTFTLTSNPGSLFSIAGNALKVAASLTAGSDAISIKADNGSGSVITQRFLITVTAG
jgi:hypothetical protein